MPRKPKAPPVPSAAPASPTSTTGSGSTQPPPPTVSGGSVPWTPGGGGKKDGELEAAAAIYTQLLEVRKVVEQLRQETIDEKLHRRLDLVPVRVGDLMQGFQAAVARANLATHAGGEGEGEDIEQMVIKNLEVSVTAPVIDAGHAEDPVLMLPNIKSPDAATAQVSLKFSVVSVPAKKVR
ncbi:MAG TPA: hypothetical protein VFR31_04885 [Thermoanaerobaculia bacterium]|nr:hypothetical protein [Thermoanaerobaculia bacterium]